jgi:hypothetical protein
VAVVGASTVVLSLCFFGVVALVDGAPGTAGRLPYYILGGALAFVATLLALEGSIRDGERIIGIAAAAGVASCATFGLAIEGIRYAVRRPELVVSSALLPYVVAAGLIATGIGFWAVNHWRELVAIGR